MSLCALIMNQPIKFCNVEGWKAFEYVKRSECGPLLYGTITGTEVCIVDFMGKVMVFDLVERNWRLVCAVQLVGGGEKECRGRQFFITAEDDIIRVHCPAPCYEEFQFTKFDRHQGKWFLSSGISVALGLANIYRERKESHPVFLSLSFLTHLLLKKRGTTNEGKQVQNLKSVEEKASRAWQGPRLLPPPTPQSHL